MEKDLWTTNEYRDFILRVDWRIKQTFGLYPVPTVLPDGSHQQGADGKDLSTKTPNAARLIQVASEHLVLARGLR